MEIPTLTVTAYAIFSLGAAAQDSQIKTTLEKEKEHLYNNFKAVDSFHATYFLDSGTGRAGTCQVAYHRAAGWAFTQAQTEGDGQPDTTRSFLFTPNKEKFATQQKQGDAPKHMVVEGIFKNTLLIQNFFAKLNSLPEKVDLLAIPFTFLSPNNFEMGIGLDSRKPMWIFRAKKLVRVTPRETILESPEHGRLIIDRSTGLIKKQVINSKEKPRTMILADLKIGVDLDFFEAKQPKTLKNDQRRSFLESGMGTISLHTLFQLLIENSSPLDLESQLALNQTNFISLLRNYFGEKNYNVIGQDTSLQILRPQLAKLSLDQELSIPEFMDHPEFRTRFLKHLAIAIRKKSLHIPAQKILTPLVGRPFEADTPLEKARKELIEEFIVQCLYRLEIERAAEAYRKELE